MQASVMCAVNNFDGYECVLCGQPSTHIVDLHRPPLAQLQLGLHHTQARARVLQIQSLSTSATLRLHNAILLHVHRITDYHCFQGCFMLSHVYAHTFLLFISSCVQLRRFIVRHICRYILFSLYRCVIFSLYVLPPFIYFAVTIDQRLHAFLFIV